jgi:hydrogenase maturation factor
MCVDPARANALLDQLRERGVSSAAIIGRVLERSAAPQIRVV